MATSSKITLPQFGAVMERSTQPLVIPQSVRYLTEDERRKLIAVLDYLNATHDLGLNRVMRAMGEKSDLKSILKNHKVVAYSLVERLAEVVGVSVEELWGISNLPPSRVGEVRDHLSNNDLVEARRYSGRPSVK